MNVSILYAVAFISLFSVFVALLRAVWVKKQDPGPDALVEISNDIRSGAWAFIRKEYKVMSFVLVLVGILLAFGQSSLGHYVSFSFFFGASMSALAGVVGMDTATRANVRTTNAAQKGLQAALKIAFTGGSVMGLSVVGFGLFGLSILIAVYSYLIPDSFEIFRVVESYALGASSVALFARVGGGIFTKAADVGADLVGKVEAGIPEDDPRNPATIADNVGDNVGDVAGLGSDLCESYVASIIGAVVLGAAMKSVDLAILPLVLAATGIVCSILGTLCVRVKEGGNPQKALMRALIIASALITLASYPVIHFFGVNHAYVTGMGIYIAMLAGLFCGVLIGIVTEYYTGDGTKSVKEIAKQSTTGAATNIIAGFCLGMKSTGLTVILLGTGMYVAYYFGGLYGIAIAAMGMLSNLGVQLSMDAYGPIADNSGGIAEMTHRPPEVRKITDRLDAVGNTTAAIGKGFAIGSATFAALALFIAYKEVAGIGSIDATKPLVMIGILIGGMLPYVFSSFVIGAVGRAANMIVEEVRRQFREIPGIMENQNKPDYVKCITIATSAAIREMMIPSVCSVFIPVVIGFTGGKEMLGGVLVGSMVSAVMLAIFMGNAGGAWDNAKKYVEGGVYGGKKSDTHKATVIGDTVGDPFKDTAGPAMDIILKLMSVVSLIIARMLPY